MNASYSPNGSVQPSATANWAPSPRQAPSVPISVYRELATELKATQALVDSLTQQNQELGQQNQLLRQEMLKFAESATQLRQVVEARPLVNLDPGEASPHGPTPSAQTMVVPVTPPPAQLSEAESSGLSLDGVSSLTHQMSQMLRPKAKTARPPAKRPRPLPPQQALFTEERLEPFQSGSSRERNADLSGLWLATTIVLIVVSAFGAGFLIMRPLLGNSR